MTTALDRTQPLEWQAPPPPAPPATGRRRTAPPPAEPVGAHPLAVLAAIGAGGLAVIALWWSNTPSLSGLGDWLTNAGRITGLLAGYGLVVLIALMGRIPPLERGVGADRLARWHAHGGRYTVSLVVAHALLITWGYAVSAHHGIIDETGTLLVSYPDVLMASVAGLLLVGVGAVSARAARRRLRYETWYYLHLYTYLAIALAFSHQFSTGAEFVSNRPARVAWASLYAVVGLALLWYRVLTPIRQALRHRMRVLGVVPEAPGVVSVIVAGEHLEELRAEAGQFFRWRFLNQELWWASNPYSLSAPPSGNRLRFTAKDFGDHSGALARLRPGTRVFAEGPYGAMVASRRRQQKSLLIAGGVGVTPLRALFQALPGPVTLVYRTSSASDVVFRHELESLAEARGAGLHILAGRRTELGGDPLTAANLRANVTDLAGHDVFVCGPAGFTESVVTALRSAGVPRRQIHTESFAF